MVVSLFLLSCVAGFAYFRGEGDDLPNTSHAGMRRMRHFSLKDEDAVAARRGVIKLGRRNGFSTVCAFERFRELGPRVDGAAPTPRNIYKAVRVDVKALVDVPIFDAFDLSKFQVARATASHRFVRRTRRVRWRARRW